MVRIIGSYISPYVRKVLVFLLVGVHLYKVLIP